MCTINDSIMVIERIIEEKKSKYVANEHCEGCKRELQFYEECRLQHIREATEGADFSKCLTFYDLCDVSHAAFLKTTTGFNFEECIEFIHGAKEGI